MATQPLPEFDPIRRRLQNQFSRQRQASGDALTRRFASQGMLNSGAFSKMQQEQERELAQSEADAMGQVDFQEAQEAQRRREIAEGRGFQTSEREAAQKYGTSEREGSQAFNRRMFDDQFGLQQKQFDFQKEQAAIENAEAVKNNYLTQLSNMDADWDDPEELQDLINRLKGFGITPPTGLRF
jgi:hypothetical protein